jgi:hypothetical protein
MAMALFIGGTNDGLRADVELQPFVELLNKEDRKNAFIPKFKTQIERQGIRREQYRRLPIITGKTTWIVYAIGSMRDSDAIGALIDGYKKGGE